MTTAGKPGLREYLSANDKVKSLSRYRLIELEGAGK